MSEKNHKEKRLKGIPVSDGIAIGTLYFLSNSHDEFIPEFSIANSEVEREINRYRRALSSSRDDLQNLQKFLVREGSVEAISIIDTHIQMLDDPLMTTLMEDKIRQMLRNTEAVFRTVMIDYEKQFSRVEDSFFKQRLLDVKDLSKRILKHLYPRKSFSINDVPENSIIYAQEIVPSDTAEAQISRISAFISQYGGGTSHAALIARSKGIPFVTSIEIKDLHHQHISLMILDGGTGEVILNPKDETIQEYQKKKDESQRQYEKIIQEIDIPTQTRDGFPIQILANIESLYDLDLLKKYKVEGIGLFRSEFLFLQKELSEANEEQQFSLYKEIAQRVENLPVVIRLFDVGGDKGGFPHLMSELNPALGCRAIRFLLRYRDIFRIQVRALLRASLYGDIKILIPLISDMAELLEARQFIDTVKEELIGEGYEFPKPILIGSMMEVPSAVIMSNSISKHSDFLSIGTNDLVQYTLAADRSNQMICNIFKPAHPSIMHMIKMIIDSGRKNHTPVSLCGEIASNPLYVPLLIGLGINSLSCAPRYIPSVKKIIRRISKSEVEVLAQKILASQTSLEVYEILSSAYADYIQQD